MKLTAEDALLLVENYNLTTPVGLRPGREFLALSHLRLFFIARVLSENAVKKDFYGGVDGTAGPGQRIRHRLVCPCPSYGVA